MTLNKRKECLTKVRYGTLEEVQKAISFNERTSQIKLGYYECIWCRGFHLTSKR